MRLTPKPRDKTEAVRWIRSGIEITVLDSESDRPIQAKDGRFEIREQDWTAIVTIRSGIVVHIE